MEDSLPPPDRIRVLVCDDSDALRVLLLDMLSFEPHLDASGEARNGQEAINEARTLQPDVILLDLSMPIMTGLAALPAIKQAAPNAKIIAFTALSGSVIEKAVLKAGADRFLEKGAAPHLIIEAIEGAYAATSTPTASEPTVATEVGQTG
jgi:DNA-binding NarL/FixJ family response regulator